MADTGRWVTIRGTRVFIKDGETPTEAITRQKKENTKKSVNKKHDPFSKESLYKTRKNAFSGKITKDTTFEEYYKYKFGEDYSSDMDEDDEIAETRKEFERMKHEVLAEKKGGRGGESDLDMRDRVAEDKEALDKKAWKGHNAKVKPLEKGTRVTYKHGSGRKGEKEFTYEGKIVRVHAEHDDLERRYDIMGIETNRVQEMVRESKITPKKKR